MAYAGKRVGRHDPEAILVGASTIQELEPGELLSYWYSHRSAVNTLTMIMSGVDTADIRAVTKVSDRLQYHSPNDDPEIVEVIDVLSSNAYYFEEIIDGDEPVLLEEVIDNNPLIQALATIKHLDRHARTWRMWRSLIAIANLSPSYEAQEPGEVE